MSHGRSKFSWVASNVRDMTDVECAYIGAFLDGEGCVYYDESRERYSLCVLSNTEVEFISSCLRILGTGRIKMSRGRPPAKPCWQVVTDKALEIEDICQQIAPYSLKAQKYLDETRP